MRKCILLLFIVGWFSAPYFAVAHDRSSLLIATQQQLLLEQTRHDILLKKLHVLQSERRAFQPHHLTSATLQRLTLMMAMAKAEVDSLDLSLNEAQQATALTQDHVQAAKERWRQATSTTFAVVHEQQIQKQYLQEQQDLFSLQQKRIKLLRKTLKVAQQILENSQEWKMQLQMQYQLQRQLHRQQALNQLSMRLQQEQGYWLAQLTQLKQQLQSKETNGLIHNPSYLPVAFKAFQAEEYSNLIQVQLNLAKLMANLSTILNDKFSLANLSDLQKKLEILDNQFQKSGDFIQQKIDIFKQYLNWIIESIKNKEICIDNNQIILTDLRQLLNNYEKQFIKIKLLQQQSKVRLDTVTEQLQRKLANQKGLPGLDFRAWLHLGQKIAQVPALAVEKVISLCKTIASKIITTPGWRVLLILLIALAWFGIWFKLHRFLLSVDIVRLRQKGHGFFSAQTFIVVLQLLSRHLMGIMLLIGLIGFLSWFGIPPKTFFLFVSITSIFLVFSIVIQLARILLLENTTDTSGHDVKLHYRLRLTLLIGEIITISSLLVHQLPVSYEIRDLFVRLFMLFLLFIALALMKSWVIIPKLLAPYLEKKHTYLKQGVRWLSFLLPFSLFSNALLGLIGYVDLAWGIATYQGIFLLTLVAYLLVRGLTDEVVRWLSEQCIRRLRNGWLWSEALLKPLHQILKLVILLSTAWVLILYNQGKYAVAFDTNLSHLLTTELFVIAGSTVTILTIVELVLAGAVLVWMSHWSREFAYRWLFANTKDLGLRNSFAIFTQYATLATGIIITLNVAGLTLNALSLILSAFALGIGFGLRDLFNNLVTGILLLLERPIKIGDWVTIGTYEGQVTHIGARSITVNTEDHQELLVPNTDVFSKHFINWTHHDSIVRVLVPLCLSRKDQPARARQIILEVLASIPKILSHPPTEVYFKDIDQMLLQFKVEYYVDLKYIVSRSEVRSQFLFALWERFNQEGILPPDVVHALHIVK